MGLRLFPNRMLIDRRLTGIPPGSKCFKNVACVQEHGIVCAPLNQDMGRGKCNSNELKQNTIQNPLYRQYHSE